MRAEIGPPNSRIVDVRYAAVDEAVSALPRGIDDKLDGRVWKDRPPVVPEDEDVRAFGATGPVRWPRAARLLRFGLVVEFDSDWGPWRVIVPQVRVDTGVWPYSWAVQYHPGVVARVEEDRKGQEVAEKNVLTTVDDRLLTPAEVATLFRVDPKTVSRWAKAGRITAVRTPGGHRRFYESEVNRLWQRPAEDDQTVGAELVAA